ncbi:centromere/kinetochore protein zw10-like protein [Plakobranchus ocellatus]|uniref:Centromere/kinetochore protein zw10-like protein n=1 Tax=Plakobranchus ocellatus TaxID=259542 RepID=A0AAV3Y6N8_9GAST|nr:centromere/kinetochore protein zw10-like protein [Plakobranchus ocellatus]
MSFVAQVLQHLDQFEQKAAHEKVEALTSKLNNMTVEVYQLAESKFVDFKPNLATSEKLEARATELRGDISELEEKINNKFNNHLSFSVGEFHNLNSKLTELKAIYEALDHLAKIVSLIQESNNAVTEKHYSRASAAISEAEILFKHPLTNQDDEITILKAMKEELVLQKSQLECLLLDLWRDFVKWNIKTDKKSKQHQEILASSVQEVSLSVSCDGECHSELTELVKGLNKQNLLLKQMTGFADTFKKFVVPLIVDYPELAIHISSSGPVKTMSIIPKKEPEAVNKNSKNKPVPVDPEKAYISVFANLNHIMAELNAMLLSSELGMDNCEGIRPGASQNGEDLTNSAESNRGSTLMSWLGAEVGPWMLDLLQKTVIAKAVPTNSKDLASFQDVIKTVEMVHEKLSDIGFIRPDNQILLNSVQNVNLLFSNKKSQSILVEARELMNSSLHESVAVTDDKPLGEWAPLTPGGVRKVQRLEVAANHQLSDNTFRMPRCRISETMQTLITLAYETLEEATENSQECALQMLLAVRSMFEMFCKVVPTHHRHALETFPQIAALHHNNCMFISHHLMTLGHQFAARLPVSVNPTFVDLIMNIRAHGVDVFLAQIRRQEDLLLECLEGAQGFGQLEDKARAEAASRSIKQAMLQLEHLQKIWKPVLPINNYKKAMGKLINCVVTHITSCTCSLEDIAQAAAKVLLQLLEPLEPRCGEMLVLPGEAPSVELTRHVASWQRLSELQLVLDASLSDIGDRWAGGQGPLALAFTSTEVRQLVRALFQNTDRRANLLTTIK